MVPHLILDRSTDPNALVVEGLVVVGYIPLYRASSFLTIRIGVVKCET